MKKEEINKKNKNVKIDETLSNADINSCDNTNAIINTSAENPQSLNIGVALGGGGMCGFAHIGFLQVLEENGIIPNMVAGVSMGAIVGGFYATGWTPKELERLAKTISKSQIIEPNFFKMIKEGLVSGKKIEKFLEKNLRFKNIEDSTIKFYAGATDLKTGDIYYFESGSFVTALRASSAIPGVFPVKIAGETSYGDGGLVENVPFNILKKKGADVIIAVDCLNPYDKDNIPKNSVNALVYGMEVMQHKLIEFNKKLNRRNYDIYCLDTTEGVSHLDTDFKVIPRLIESGRNCALKNMDKIKEIIKNKQLKLINKK